MVRVMVRGIVRVRVRGMVSVTVVCKLPLLARATIGYLVYKGYGYG